MTTDADGLLQFFAYSHLPPRLQDVSRPFCELAFSITRELPSNPERTETLRKLLEAKDCAVRACLYKPPAEWPRGGGPVPPHWPGTPGGIAKVDG